MNRRNVLTLIGSGITFGSLYSYNTMKKSAIAANINIPNINISKNNTDSNLRFKFNNFELTTSNINPNQDIIITFECKLDTDEKYIIKKENKIEITNKTNKKLDIVNQLNSINLKKLAINQKLTNKDDKLDIIFKISINHIDINKIIKKDKTTIQVIEYNIPEYAESYWPFSTGSGSKFNDKLSSIDGTISDAIWVNNDTYIDGYGLEWNINGGQTATNTN